MTHNQPSNVVQPNNLNHQLELLNTQQQQQQQHLHSSTSSLLNRRQPYIGTSTTPNLELRKPELFDSPPTSNHRLSLDNEPPFLPTHNHPIRPSLNTNSRHHNHHNNKRFNVHVLTLLPAFALGLFISYTFNPLKSISISNNHYIQPILEKTPILKGIIIKPKEIDLNLNEDYIYFNSNLNPIKELIKQSKVKWDAKIKKQSKNLNEAIKEYKKRYHNRNPPLGFDKWFDWCLKNDIILIDEFDRIFELIEPFWAISPHVIRNRSEQAGLGEVHSIFRIKDGKVKVEGKRKDDARTKDQLNLLEGFVKYLPDVNITMSHHDGPSVFLDYKTKLKHLKHARAGTVIPDEEVDIVEDDAGLTGFVGACAPDSPMRMYANGLLEPPPSGVGFIGLDHSRTMDLCLHPEWQSLHGFTSWQGPRPGLLTPIFSFSQSSSFSNDILISPLEQFSDLNLNLKQYKSFKSKNETQKLMWRGKTTGVWFDREFNWRSSHRMRLHNLGKFNSTHQFRDLHIFNENDDQIKVERKKLNELVNRFLSVNFVGPLVQCSIKDGTCDAVKKEIEFGELVDWEFQNNHRYVLDVDGNSWSGRFRRLLGSDSLVFKSTIWPEWYRDLIQPWYHYIPVRIDYLDLFDLLSFFSTNPIHAENIANQGKDWVEKHFRYQDLQAYMWRTYLEYARVSSDDRLKMNFEL
ncbi:hypothetical protein CROQUDRAFT_83232 [Cronartium quercuum f. sp. fusiforme G11]|uniref:Glycosyl transferase CAP10 domain-containing protein n=1 Tax=Cronartium quercuum f. sp. fusiforme G11 TaxID=708437 RepID=A0A9P6N9E5_9BASI|nr:hypothetical protein CROQUDRAFT_83232 [Cronartium quercuum f. sp. fusiforme G11]